MKILGMLLEELLVALTPVIIGLIIGWVLVEVLK